MDDAEPNMDQVFTHYRGARWRFLTFATRESDMADMVVAMNVDARIKQAMPRDAWFGNVVINGVAVPRFALSVGALLLPDYITLLDPDHSTVLFRHYKGGAYSVMFRAVWGIPGHADSDGRSFTELSDVELSAIKTETYVVYSSQTDGRVWLRSQDDFNGMVNINGVDVARFFREEWVVVQAEGFHGGIQTTGYLERAASEFDVDSELAVEDVARASKIHENYTLSGLLGVKPVGEEETQDVGVDGAGVRLDDPLSLPHRYLNLAVINIGDALTTIGNLRQRGKVAGEAMTEPVLALRRAIAALEGRPWVAMTTAPQHAERDMTYAERLAGRGEKGTEGG